MDYMVFASTLLGIVREGKIMDHDNEIDVCVIGDDLTDEKMERLRASGYYLSDYRANERIGETYFSKDGSMQGSWVAISPIWKKGETCFINMTLDDCITLPPDCYDKRTWDTVEYIGRQFKCPHDREKWLERWYGSDWKTPKPCHWTDNVNRRKWGDI